MVMYLITLLTVAASVVGILMYYSGKTRKQKNKITMTFIAILLVFIAVETLMDYNIKRQLRGTWTEGGRTWVFKSNGGFQASHDEHHNKQEYVLKWFGPSSKAVQFRGEDGNSKHYYISSLNNTTLIIDETKIFTRD